MGKEEESRCTYTATVSVGSGRDIFRQDAKISIFSPICKDVQFARNPTGLLNLQKLNKQDAVAPAQSHHGHVKQTHCQISRESTSNKS